MSWARELGAARAAVTFLTRVPVGGHPHTAESLGRAGAYFPLVGAALGCAMAAVWLASQRAGAWPAAVLAVIASLLLTGGFHEDGLADTADALGAPHRDRERILAIAVDPRIGSYGALALGASLLLRVALIAGFEAGARGAAWIVLAQCLSRSPPVYLMARLPYVSPEGVARSRPLVGAGWREVLVAALWPLSLAAALWALGFLAVIEGAAALFAAVAAAGLCGWRFRVRVGGVTGDTLGATQQVGECAILLALVWFGGEVG